MLSHCDTWSFATRYMVFGASIHGLSQLDRCLFAIEKFLAAVFIAQTRRPRAPVRPKSQHNFLSKNHNKRQLVNSKHIGARGTMTHEESHKKSAYLLATTMALADTRSSKLYKIFQILLTIDRHKELIVVASRGQRVVDGTHGLDGVHIGNVVADATHALERDVVLQQVVATRARSHQVDSWEHTLVRQ